MRQEVKNMEVSNQDVAANVKFIIDEYAFKFRQLNDRITSAANEASASSHKQVLIQSEFERTIQTIKSYQESITADMVKTQHSLNRKNLELDGTVKALGDSMTTLQSQVP